MNQVQLYKQQELQKRSTREPYITANSSVSNLFGTIARNNVNLGTNMDFIPKDANSNIIPLGNQNVNPQWLGLEGKEMQFWAYIYCSPLASVIDKLAEADTNGILGVRNDDGTEIDNVNKNPKLKRIIELLNNPNPLQTWAEFNSEQVVFAKIFGYCPVFAVAPVGFDKSYTKYLFNINPLFITPEKNENFNIFTDPRPIVRWSINIFGQTYPAIPAEDILIVKDGFITKKDALGLPISKVAGTDYMVSNICAAMEADNVLLKKKGPLGVFSHDPKPDVGGWQPMSDPEKKELQEALAKYGLSWTQFQYVISKQPIKWNAMSYNLKDLMTKETIRQAIDGLCDRFGFPAELMSGKNATYENRNSAEKFMYQNNIIPFSLRRMQRYDKFFEITSTQKLILNYDHLAVLQEDILKAGQAKYRKSQSLDIDWKNDIITYNEYRVAQGYKPVAGMDIKYSEYIKKFNIDNGSTPPKDTGVKK